MMWVDVIYVNCMMLMVGQHVVTQLTRAL